jgi:hypothetical protein
VSGLVDVTYCGLRISLSAVLAGLPAAGIHSAAIFADTLVLDIPQIAASGLVIVARNVDVTALKGAPLLLAPPAGGVVVQAMLGASTGGPLRIALASAPDAPLNLPAGLAPLSATLCQAATGAPLAALPSGGAASVRDLVSRSWALNAMQAGYEGASAQMDDGSSSARLNAQAMLAWIVACTASLAEAGEIPSDYAMLYNQAAALLVTLNVAPGAIFVPVLAGNFYSQQMSSMLTVIRDYEAKLNTLATQQDIAAAIATVSATLQDVAGDEITPLSVQLNGISTNTQSLYDDICDLRGKFTLQNQRAHTAFLVLGDEIAVADIKATLQAELDMAMGVISLGFDAFKAYKGDADGIKDGVKDSVDAVQKLVALIKADQGSSGGDDLTSGASDLLTSQMQLMQTVLSGRLLWQQAIDSQSGGVLPGSLSAITIDPVTDWDNYIVAAEAEIASVKRQIGDGPQQDAADNYLASLKILAGFGKAIGAKFVAYVGQLVQATIVIAQIKAAQNVEARWAATQATATSQAEQLAALKALVQGRMDAIKRALYVAWTYYAASYFYITFNAPPRMLHLDMDAADMEAALVGVADWVARAIGTAPDGQKVKLRRASGTSRCWRPAAPAPAAMPRFSTRPRMAGGCSPSRSRSAHRSSPACSPMAGAAPSGFQAPPSSSMAPRPTSKATSLPPSPPRGPIRTAPTPPPPIPSSPTAWSAITPIAAPAIMSTAPGRSTRTST